MLLPLVGLGFAPRCFFFSLSASLFFGLALQALLIGFSPCFFFGAAEGCFFSMAAGFCLGALAGGIFGGLGMAFKKLNFLSRIPFGPFLALATLISIFFGGSIVDWYINTFMPKPL